MIYKRKVVVGVLFVAFLGVNGTSKWGCPPGFDGYNCEDDVDECADLEFTVCKNGGTCINTIGSYECRCLSESADCSKDKNECLTPGICRNGGSCISDVSNFHCNCLPGWQFRFCEQDIDECEKEDQCGNGGTCRNTPGSFECSCRPGFSGARCKIPNTPKVCDEHSQCTTMDQRALCGRDRYCKCSGAWQGPLCTENVNECKTGTHKCMKHEHCKDIKGSYVCEDSCHSKPCENGGRCRPGRNHASYTCECQDGFTGKDCEVDVDDCVGVVCQNGGSCKDLVNGYQCKCLDRNNGKHCELDCEDGCEMT